MTPTLGIRSALSEVGRFQLELGVEVVAERVILSVLTRRPSGLTRFGRVGGVISDSSVFGRFHALLAGL
jgi:hypothetical protein